MIFKNTYIFLFLLITGAVHGMNVSVTKCAFKSGDQAYIEIYSKFKGESVQWSAPLDKPNDVRSQIEMLCIISQDDKIMIAEKYNIQSPLSEVSSDYWDRRIFGLENGNYSLQLRFVDLNNPRDTLDFKDNIVVDFDRSEVAFSDILLMEEASEENEQLAFSRHNFYYEPLEFNLLDAKTKHLIFFAEIYHLAEQYDEQLFVKYFLENADAEGMEKYSKTGYKKIEPEEVNTLLLNFKSDELLSGNYILHLELNEKSRKMITSQTTRFSVYNPLEDYKQQLSPDAMFERCFFQSFTRDELDYSLKAVFPKVGNNLSELVNSIVRSDELEPKKYFLYSYWSAYSIEEMRTIYDAYMDVARAVDNTFATNVFHGFETDRGRTFLKYGKPDDIVFEEDEQTAPPYEIWIYNYIDATQQTNVKFLFYNPSLATNDFILLHSNCRGERNNPRWEMDLYSDAYNESPSNYIDERQMPSNFNRNARRYFSDF